MSKRLVLCTLPLHPAAVALLQDAADVIVAPDSKADTLKRMVGDADILLVRSQLPPDIFDAPNRLLGVIRNGTGLDLIPVASATAHGIPVANVPGANVQAVAEYCVGAMLLLSRKLDVMNRDLRTRGWNESRAHTSDTQELGGKTMGIVGLGNIGKRIATICKHAFGMRVLGYQPRREGIPDYVEAVEIDELFRRSDVVSFNCPLTPQTRHLLDERRLGLMKPTALVINAARGAVIDEDALARALAEKRIGGAAIDVFSEQPLPRDSAFFGLDNVILTPHAAALTPESFEQMSVGSARQMLQIFAGERPQYLVNPEVWDAYMQRRNAR